MLDIAVEGRPEEDAAQILFDAIADNKVMGYLFPSSLKDFYFIARRDMDDQTRRAWISLFLDTFLVTEFSRKTCEAALASDEPDFEDGLIRAAAEQEGCDYIITRDVEAFASGRVRGVSPKDYCEQCLR